MKKFFLSAAALFLLLIVIPIFLQQPRKTEETPQNSSITATPRSAKPVASPEPDLLRQEKILTIRERNNSASLTLKSYTVEPFQGKTDVYTGSGNLPRFSLPGFFRNAYSIDIEDDGNEELVVEVETGHSIDSSVYKYSNKKLNRILISNGPSTILESITTRNTPEFKDTNHDGVLEMFVYYRFFPPEKRRRVELYKFDGQRFSKIKEYEEATSEFYL